MTMASAAETRMSGSQGLCLFCRHARSKAPGGNVQNIRLVTVGCGTARQRMAMAGNVRHWQRIGCSRNQLAARVFSKTSEPQSRSRGDQARVARRQGVDSLRRLDRVERTSPNMKTPGSTWKCADNSPIWLRVSRRSPFRTAEIVGVAMPVARATSA